MGQSVNYLSPLTLSDRFRTMINVLGDALAAGIMAQLCRKDFEKAANNGATHTPSNAENGGGPNRVRRTIYFCSGYSAHARVMI